MAGVLLVLSQTFSRSGGIPAFNRLLCRACVEYGIAAGLPVQVLSLNDARESSAAYDWSNARFHGANRNKLLFLRLYLTLLIKQRPQVVIGGHVNLSPLLPLARRLDRNSQTAVVVHGVEAWGPLSLLRRYGLRSADHVLSVSRFTADCVVRQHGVDAQRVTWFPDAVDPFWLKDALRSLKRVSSDEDKLVLLTVGRMDTAERYKGVDTVIQALPGLQALISKRVEYWVVGGGTDLARLQALATELSITEQVHFWGQVDLEELARCYASCDVFVLPSRGEGFGIVFLEAMAFAKPIVAAAAGAVPEVVLNAETGILVDYGDVPSLITALNRLISDAALRSRLGEAGRKRLLANFTYEHFAARVAELLTRNCQDRARFLRSRTCHTL